MRLIKIRQESQMEVEMTFKKKLKFLKMQKTGTKLLELVIVNKKKIKKIKKDKDDEQKFKGLFGKSTAGQLV